MGTNRVRMAAEGITAGQNTPMLTTVIMLVTALTAPQAAPRPKAFWRDVVSRDFAVPPGTTAPALAAELSRELGNPDPEMRDDLATSILSTWIDRRVLTPVALRALTTEWTGNLSAPGDGVLRRSFSALMLAAVITRDNAEPFLTGAEVAGIREAALAYLVAETDLRGYDDRLGWIHATAHTADLVRALIRSRSLPAGMQATMLDAVGRRLVTAPAVFTCGEDERLARAVAMLLIRDDFQLEPFTAWVTRMTAPSNAPVSTATLAVSQNVKNMLAKLGVLLARQPTLPTGAAAARDAVLKAVRF